MRDLILVFVTFAAFVAGFFLMKKIDNLLAENQQHMTEENRNNKQ